MPDEHSFPMSKPSFVYADDLIYFGYLKVNDRNEIAAVVAIPKSYFGSDPETNSRIVGYCYGVMDQGMKHNPVLSMFDEWDFLEEGWTPVMLCDYTTIVL